jgi:hypothetical protein
MTDFTSDINKYTDSLPWVDLIDVFKSEKYFDIVQAIPEETLHFAANPDNRDFMIKSALKSLQKSNPEETNEDQAKLLADLMSVMARMFLQDRKTTKR